MTPVAYWCLVVALSALGLCCATWYSRFSRSVFDEPNQTDRGRLRNSLALAALLCASSSAAIYVAFLLSWAISSHALDGRQPLGAAAIWVGFVCAAYGVVGGLFARGAQRLIIVVSSVASGFFGYWPERRVSPSKDSHRWRNIVFTTTIRFVSYHSGD
jgi:hypothetical protein